MLVKTELKAYNEIVGVLEEMYREYYSYVYENQEPISEINISSKAIELSYKYRSKLEELIEKYIKDGIIVRLKDNSDTITKKMYKKPNDLNLYVKNLLTKAKEPYFNATISKRCLYIANVLYTETLKYRSGRKKAIYKEMFKEFHFLRMISLLSARLLFSEVKRLERDATVMISIDCGVKYLRWLPSNRAKSVRKKDICDEYREYTNPDIDLKDNKGVFFTEEYPEYPHPNCNCLIEIL